jgi:FlgD Ig-like domain
VLYVDTHRHYQLYDLKQHTLVDLTTAYNLRGNGDSADLWGNYLVYAAKDGSIWRKNLSSSAKPVRLDHGREDTPLRWVSVYTFGDWVAWGRNYGLTDFNTSWIWVRNARTMAPATKLAHWPEQATTAGLLSREYVNTREIWRLRTWAGRSITLHVPAQTWFMSVDGAAMAWIDSSYDTKVAPLPVDVFDRPRSLGNPLAAKTLTIGRTWGLDLVASATLTSCRVTISTSTGHLMRSLGCSAGAARLGEVIARWDGRNAAGHYVANGTYKWRILAGNADGTMLRSDGVATSSAGSITVRR